MDPGNRKAVLAAMAANAGIAAAKFVGFAFTGASSMLAEGVHSVADTGNQALLLWGGASAARSPTAQHPFGFGRERYFWAFVVSLVLFSLGGLFAVYEGVEKLQHPEPLSAPGWAFGILGLALALEGWSFRTALHAARATKGVLSWRQFILRTKNPELPVVLLEDLGALLGLALAMLGVTAAVLTGDGRWDGAGSIVIGLLLGLIAALLAMEMKSLLIGEAANDEDRAAIARAIEHGPRVRRVISMRTEHLSADEILLGCKVEFDASLDMLALTDAIDEAEARVRAAVPSVRLIYMEPDVFEQREPGQGG